MGSFIVFKVLRGGIWGEIRKGSWELLHCECGLTPPRPVRCEVVS